MTISNKGTFILVSGANRGIGFELVKALLQRYPEAVIFAGTRDPSSSDALNNLAAKHPNVRVIELVANDEESNKQAIEEVKKVTDRLDIVVANAGINAPFLPIHAEDPKHYKPNFEVNVLGPLYLYQATYPLLMETRTTDSTLPAPKFFTTSSMAGSTGGVPPMFISGAYGASKAAANYVVHGIHEQTEKFGAVVIPYHPGLVNTDMAKKTSTEFGLDIENFPGVISPEESAAGYADLIVKSTRAEHGGKFWGHGIAEPIPW